MTTTWQSYRRLLNQLHSKDTALPLETISSAISHHLIFASPPTQLTASVVVSPLFVNGSFDRLNALQIAFRHAVLLQNKPQDEANSSIFTSIFRLDARTRLSQWLRLVLQGLQGGAPVSRLMCYCGLMCGLGDLRVQLQTPDVDSVVNSAVLTRLQGELVLALAEVLDLYYPSNDGSEPHWLIQFHSQHSKGPFAFFPWFGLFQLTDFRHLSRIHLSHFPRPTPPLRSKILCAPSSSLRTRRASMH
ncbi:hypothetical protein DL96DRAFT_167504 [Flagelloscypha sp. PMI_526]|nr:hypothetical protein DL96DRAFT_167504 [Flagelloscypha sp. PMI_526]